MNISNDKKGNSTTVAIIAVVMIIAIIAVAAIALSQSNNDRETAEQRSTIILTIESNNFTRSSYDIYFDNVKTETVQIEGAGTYTASKTYTWQKGQADGKDYTVKIHQYNSFGQEDDQRTITIYKGQTHTVTLTA